MIHHLVTGTQAAQAITAAVSVTPSMAGEVWNLEEQLQVGPVARTMNQTFDATRAAWWATILPEEKEPPAGAQELVLKVSNELNKDPNATVWIWMAPHPAHIAAYYFLLAQLEKHRGRIHLIQIAGLPFLDENKKLFFPKSFAGLSARELAKCQKLVRQITPSEWDMDLDFWRQLTQEPTGIRITTNMGGKKLLSKSPDFYDAALLQLCSAVFQKAQRVVAQAISKQEMPMPEYFLSSRLKALAAAGQLTLQGSADKGLRDYEVKLSGVPEANHVAAE